MAVNNTTMEMDSMARPKTKEAAGARRGSTASSSNSYERRAVVKSQITIYYFGRFDCAPFNTKELLAPAKRCATQEKLITERRLQRAMAAVAAEREEAQRQLEDTTGEPPPGGNALGVNIKDVFAQQMAQRVQEEIEEY